MATKSWGNRIFQLQDNPMGTLLTMWCILEQNMWCMTIISLFKTKPYRNPALMLKPDPIVFFLFSFLFSVSQEITAGLLHNAPETTRPRIRMAPGGAHPGTESQQMKSHQPNRWPEPKPASSQNLCVQTGSLQMWRVLAPRSHPTRPRQLGIPLCFLSPFPFLP